MITNSPGDLTRFNEKTKAYSRARERLARRCPVIKQINKTLDENEVLDINHAIDLICVDLEYKPEARPTVEALRRIQRTGGE